MVVFDRWPTYCLWIEILHFLGTERKVSEEKNRFSPIRARSRFVAPEYWIVFILSIGQKKPNNALVLIYPNVWQKWKISMVEFNRHPWSFSFLRVLIYNGQLSFSNSSHNFRVLCGSSPVLLLMLHSKKKIISFLLLTSMPCVRRNEHVLRIVRRHPEPKNPNIHGQ